MNKELSVFIVKVQEYIFKHKDLFRWKKFKTNTILPQGFWLSQILFNFVVNVLLENPNENNS